MTNIIALIWFLICWLLALIAINTPTEKTQKRALTILICIFPLLLLPILFTITPKIQVTFKKQ
jgi:hypothetical protein